MLGGTSNYATALTILQHQNCDIIFFDADVGNGNIFTDLTKLSNRKFILVITSTTPKYALQAIKANALDYLLTPSPAPEIETTCNRIVNTLHKNNLSPAQRALKASDYKTKPAKGDKLSIKIGNFYELVNTNDIVFCRADNNYTEIVLRDKRKVLISKTLKHYETTLKGYNFCRIHQSFLVNMDFVKSIEKGKASRIILRDGTSLDVSQSKRENVFRLLGV